jgi:hypothetical protein
MNYSPESGTLAVTVSDMERRIKEDEREEEDLKGFEVFCGRLQMG